VLSPLRDSGDGQYQHILSSPSGLHWHFAARMLALASLKQGHLKLHSVRKT
jgi:hypothetical protein